MIFALIDLVRYATKTGRYSPAALEAQGLWLTTHANAAANGLTKLQPGDLIFYHHSYSFLSWAVMYWSDGPMSHTAMYSGDGQVHDATTDGVVEHPLADYFDGRGYMVFQHLDATDADRLKMRKAMQEQVGGGFNWRGLIRLGLSIILGAHDDYRLKFTADFLLLFALLLQLTAPIRVVFVHVLILAALYIIALIGNRLRRVCKRLRADANIPGPASRPAVRRVVNSFRRTRPWRALLSCVKYVQVKCRS